MLKKIEMLIASGMLFYACWFNLNLYKLEPTATTDPNDNNFQYGLVDRADKIWDYASRECRKQFVLVRPLCHLSVMTDHWVPNWAQGYNLPFYYSHVPQIIIVGSYRLFNSVIPLIRYFLIITGSFTSSYACFPSVCFSPSALSACRGSHRLQEP